MRKTVVLILGGFGSGKTTLTRALRKGGAEEHAIVVEWADIKSGGLQRECARYTLALNGVAVAGSLRSGSDAIRSMEGLRKTIELLLSRANVVIIDAFRASGLFIDWLQGLMIPGLALVFVWMDLSLEANLRRLLERRATNGWSEVELPVKTYRNLLKSSRRAKSIWKYADQHYLRKPSAFVRIPDGLKPHESAVLVWQAIRAVQVDN